MKTTAYSGQVLALYLNATPIANVADNAASAPLTNAQVTLHTGDPGAGGNQSTNEVVYTGYLRVAVPRTTGGWTCSGNQAVNAALISFPRATGVADNSLAQYWGVGDAASGAGILRYTGPLASLLGPAAAIASTDVIQFGAAALAGVGVGNKVCFIAAPNGVTPGGVATNVTYFVKTLPTTDSMTISATSGGATLDVTTDGAGYWALLSTLQITQNIQPQLNAGQCLLLEF